MARKREPTKPLSMLLHEVAVNQARSGAKNIFGQPAWQDTVRARDEAHRREVSENAHPLLRAQHRLERKPWEQPKPKAKRKAAQAAETVAERMKRELAERNRKLRRKGSDV